MNVLSMFVVSQPSVTVMVLRLIYILDLARLLRSSDSLKILCRAVHASIYDSVIFSRAT